MSRGHWSVPRGILSALAATALFVLAAGDPAGGEGSPAGIAAPAAPEETRRILEDLVTRYTPEAAESLSLVVELQLPPAGTWHVAIAPGRQVSLHEGPHAETALIFAMSPGILDSIYSGRIAAATAIARARPGEKPPLDLRATAAATKLGDVRAVSMEFLQRFFNPTRPERVVLDEAHSRIVKGVHAIPLHYAPGMRSAWYMIKPGQRLNEPGKTNAYPQGYVFIAGQGRAKFDADTVAVRAGESYYVPPGVDHVVWSEGDEPLIVIWMAWGEGA